MANRSMTKRRRPKHAMLVVASLGWMLLAPAWGAPKFFCEEKIYDFGALDCNQVITHAFTIHNKGNQPLEISAIRTTCGCTVAKMAQDAIQPGETAVMEANLDLHGRKGPQHSRIYFATNDPDTLFTFLAFQGTATQDVEITPKFLAFGRLEGEEQPAKQIVVKRLQKGPVKLLGFAGDDPPFTARVDKRASHDNSETVIVVMPLKSLSPGTHQATLLIDTSKGKQEPRTIGITVWVVGEVTVLPSKLTLYAGQGPSTRFIMVNPGTVDKFDIERVEVPDDKIKAELNATPAGGYRIRISGLEGRRDLDGKSIQLHTNIREGHRVEIPIRVITGN